MKFFEEPVDLKNYIETLVIPKGGKNFIFKARPAVQEDFKHFESLCKPPEAPVFFKPNSTKPEKDATPEYLKELEKFKILRADFMFMCSLSATEGLTWDTVEEGAPETWGNIQKELEKAGFSASEVSMIFDMVVDANGLNSDKIKEATASFLAMAELQEV